MKPKNFILVTVIVAVVIVCLGIWWGTWPTVAAPERTAEAPTLGKADATPKHVAPQTIAPPVVPPMPKPDAVPVAATPTLAAEADPQADLKTSLADVARLHRAGNQAEAYRIYAPPDKFEPVLYQAMQDDDERSAQISEMQQSVQQLRDTIARSWEALEYQTPTFNDTGNEATYLKQGIIPSTDGGFAVGGNADPVTFIKINGKWYLKDGPL